MKTRMWLKIRSEIFLKVRFDEDCGPQVRLDNADFNRISSFDNLMLVGAFSEEKGKEAVWSCGSSKSPGPGGFNFWLYKILLGLFKRGYPLGSE